MLQNKKNKYFGWLSLGVIVILLLIAALFIMIQNGHIVFFSYIWKLFSLAWWIILPIPMWKLFMQIWGEYTITMFLMKIDPVLLEIIPPSDVEKSPKIMEQVFNGLHTWSTPNKLEVYCGWRPKQDRFSFEIVSTEGRVHFYVRCPKATRNNVESQIYAQYPDAEIYEVSDYTRDVPKNVPNPDWDVWGSTLKLVMRDELPIRTYRDFVEDVTGKMIDPLASMTEVMSSFGVGQHAWLQIIFTPELEPNWYPKSLAYVQELCGKEGANGSKKKKSFFNYLGEIGVIPGNVFRGLFAQDLMGPDYSSEEIVNEFNINRLAPDEQERVKAVYHNISKPGFNTSMRYVYLGKKENFNKSTGVGGVMGAIKQFADVNLNALFPDPATKTFANYYFTKSRLRYRQRKLVQEYRNRSFNAGTFVFNTEELATVFHFPDMSVKAPNLTRIEAKKGEAPPNLPVEFEPSR